MYTMLALSEYIKHAYDPDVGVLLLRLIEQLHIAHKGWDDSKVIALLTDNNQHNVDIQVRMLICSIHSNTLAHFGVILDDDVPLVTRYHALDIILDASALETSMMYTDTIETFVTYIEQKHGIDSDTIYHHFTSVEQSTISAIASVLNDEPIAVDVVKLNQVIDYIKHNPDTAVCALVSNNIPTSLPMEYYMSLLPNLRSKPKELAIDIYGIAMLTNHNTYETATNWIEAHYAQGKTRQIVLAELLLLQPHRSK